MSPPNWDDDFDFEDDDAPKKKKPEPKKNPKDDDDFFGDDAKNNKLPTINSKNVGQKEPTSQNKRASAVKNPYAENMKLRGNLYDDVENVYEELDDKPKGKAAGGKNKEPE